MFENWYDSHVHSRNSHDGQDRVADICEAALAHGLKGIAFTDHCDIYSGARACLNVKKNLLADVERARERFGEKLAISMGLELGEPHHDPSLADELTNDPALDFVIGSIHRMRGEEDFYYMDYEKADMGRLFPKYYDELIELVSCGYYDVVGHINYQVRYMTARAREGVDLSVYYEKLSEILRIVAEKGKGIEINTSGLRRGLGDILPSLEVVGMFKEAGGQIVTLGSDTHDARNVGAGIFTAMEKLKEAGFERFAFFERRRPTAYPIA